MPRNYQRKTTRQSWTVGAMEAALNAVETAEMGYKKAPKEFGVPRNTLKRRHLGINKNAKGSSKTLGSYTAVFSANIEWQNGIIPHIHSRMGLLEKTGCKDLCRAIQNFHYASQRQHQLLEPVVSIGNW